MAIDDLASAKSYTSPRQLLRSPLIWLSLLAAVLYSSWPLSFFLDPVAERTSLASTLEAPHHPYSWLFVAMDVLTGVVLLIVAGVQFRKHAHWATRSIVAGYVFFGILVAVAALTPLVCDPSLQNCGPILSNWRLVVHGLASIVSVLFLLLALVSVLRYGHQNGAARGLLIGLWFVLLAWGIFGAGSVVQILWHLRGGRILQDFFITVCSVSIVAVVVAIELQASLAVRSHDG